MGEFQTFIRHKSELDRFLAALRTGDMDSFPLLRNLSCVSAGARSLSPCSLEIFTFVRDPIQRFESGFAEAVWRTGPHLVPSDERGMYKVESTETVKGFLRRLLDFNRTGLAGLEHMYAMAGVFFAFNVSLAGRLEQFKTDWELVAGRLGLPGTFNEELGRHATSVHHPRRRDSALPLPLALSEDRDPNDLRLHFRRLLREEPAYHRAVCEIMLIDYVCLPEYPLPPPCAHLAPARTALANRLRALEESQQPMKLSERI